MTPSSPSKLSAGGVKQNVEKTHRSDVPNLDVIRPTDPLWATLWPKASYDLVIIMITFLYLQYHRVVMAPGDLREALKIGIPFDFVPIFKLLDFVTC